MGTITRVKTRFARAREGSWHYSIVNQAWDKTMKKGKVKACKYWWVMLPTSLVLTGMIYPIVISCFAVAAFFGRFPDWKENDMLPYKTRKDGSKWPRFVPAPYQVAIPVFLIWLFYFIWTNEPRVILGLVVVLLILLFVGIVAYLATRGLTSSKGEELRKVTSTSISAGWSKMCPVLEVIPSSSNKDEGVTHSE